MKHLKREKPFISCIMKPNLEDQHIMICIRFPPHKKQWKDRISTRRLSGNEGNEVVHMAEVVDIDEENEE